MNTNFSGNFSMDITSAIGYSANLADFRILVDDDGNLSDATVYKPIFSFANGVVTVTGISNAMIPVNSTKYVTLALVCSFAAPTAAVIQPTCTISTGTINISSPVGSGFSYTLMEQLTPIPQVFLPMLHLIHILLQQAMVRAVFLWVL